MAVMSACSVRVALPTRNTPVASAWPTPPRVYSPLYPRRLTHAMAVPMALPVTQSPGGGAPAGASAAAATAVATRRGSPLSFLKR